MFEISKIIRFFYIVQNYEEVWRRQWHPTAVLLPGKYHGWRSLISYSPWGLKELDTTELLHFHFHSLSQASRKVEFFPWRRLNSFFLLLSALLRLVQWFVWASCRVRVVGFCFLVFPLMGKAEWGGNPVCWWLGLYFCFIYYLDEASCIGCYWWLGDAGSCIQVVSFLWVLTIWYSLGLVLW